jgi:hypothetical protein
MGAAHRGHDAFVRRLFDGGRYGAVFAVAAAAPLVGFAAWSVLDASQPRQ